MPVPMQGDNWADKYQRSDHHKDRMVRNVLEYEEATGHAYPEWKKRKVEVEDMVHGGLFLGGDVSRRRVADDDLDSPVDLGLSYNKAFHVSNHAAQDADALTAASRRHDRHFLNDVNNKLAAASQPSRSSYVQDSTPVYIGSRYPRTASPAPPPDTRRRSSLAPRVTDYEVTSYLTGGPLGRPPSSRAGSVPPPSARPSVPRWAPPRPPVGGVREGSVPRSHNYSREALEPYEDVVVGVAHTSLYGDIVIGIPYNKRHMFNVENETKPVGNGPNFVKRSSVASPAGGGGLNYRRASVAASPRRNPYEDLELELISTPHSTRPRSRASSKQRFSVEDDDDDVDNSTRKFANLRGRAQSLQRQLDGRSEHRAPSLTRVVPPSAPTASAPHYSTPTYVAPSAGANARLPPRAQKPPISEARRKARDLLCKTKNDPHYFD